MVNKVLVTGASGFIGTQILTSLENCENPPSVTVISRPSSSKLFFKFKCVKNIIYSDNIFLENQNWWDSVCQDVDNFIHAAWYVETGKYINSDKNIECFEGTKKIALSLYKNGVNKFVGLGTCLEYDTTERYLSVTTKLAPKSLYAQAKMDTYLYFTNLFKNSPEKFLWCRLFYVYGENENEQRLHTYIERCIQNDKVATIHSGHKIRDYMNVKEVGSKIATYCFDQTHGVVNICSGTPVSIADIARSIAIKHNRLDLLNFQNLNPNKTDDDFIVGIIQHRSAYE